MISEALTIIYRFLLDHFGPQDWWPADTKTEIIIGAILTQNTNWVNVEKAIEKLKANNAINFDYLLSAPVEKIASMIRSSGYYNQKAERLKIFAEYIKEKYNGNLEQLFNTPTDKLREELINIKGIGPETADDILLYAGDKKVFVIDAYTKRILSRHFICDENIDYHSLQELFHNSYLQESVDYFKEYHSLLVMTGKRFCLKNEPKCSECPLARVPSIYSEN
ncbi:MAG: endonuclease III domain-containing protein [Acidobacteria bacterium]|nr:endonuclease III domain-containing protein [Acidobacteriota bacterium]